MAPKIKNVKKKYLARKKGLNLLRRYYDIFEYRYGITDGVSHTQRETGEKFGISAVRIGQIEARVVFELRK